MNLTQEQTAELTALCERHVRLGEQIAALEQLRKITGAQVEGYLPEDKDEKLELVVGDFKISRQRIDSERVDGKLLKEKYPPIAAECSKPSSYIRMTVTELPRPDAGVLQNLAEFAAKVQHDPAPPRPQLQAPTPAPAPEATPAQKPTKLRKRRR